VIARLRRTLDVELTVRTLFEAPTLAGFTAAVAAALGERSVANRLPLTREEGPRELSPGQEYIWFLHQLKSANAAFNLVSALRLTGTLDVGALERGLVEVVRRHEVLRSAFPSRKDCRSGRCLRCAPWHRPGWTWGCYLQRSKGTRSAGSPRRSERLLDLAHGLSSGSCS